VDIYKDKNTRNIFLIGVIVSSFLICFSLCILRLVYKYINPSKEEIKYILAPNDKESETNEETINKDDETINKDDETINKDNKTN